MIVGLLNVSLFLNNSSNLKDKRRILTSIKDGLRRRFNISIGVVDDEKKYNYSQLGVACVSSNVHFVRDLLNRVLRAIEDRCDVEVINVKRSIL
ncbi:MAG: hypothetical protein B5M53_00925 [Candidatus Cloacimonas sp. 4484_209]|nr:MAG: hypothetical protein B5M53_00925 [Candidatus Cloacimonas sp. 4484_209]